MIVLTILAIALSIGAIVLCARTNLHNYECNEAMFELLKQHNENMRHMTNCMELLDQRIKKLEEVKKRKNYD
mgnify:CR=1 FL=1